MSDSVEPAAKDLVPVAARELLGYEDIACEEQAAPPRQLVLKQNRLFLLTDDAGNIVPPGACELGFFREDTRVLSHYELTVSETRPGVLSSHASRVFASQIDLTITDREFGAVFTEPKNFLHIRREQLLDGMLVDRMILTNFMGRSVDLRIRLRFAADYADIFEVRGAERSERGQFFRPEVAGDEVAWAYRGLDDRLRRTLLRFRPRPDRLEAASAEWDIRLRPKETTELEIQVRPEVEADASTTRGDAAFAERYAELRAGYDEWHAHSTQLRSQDGFFNAALRQSITDLHALRVDAGEQAIITAGIPWFTAPFGRDSLITSLQTLMVNPDIAKNTLRYLAAHQGTKEDDWTEEEPGKIMHELRRGEMAAAGEVPHVPYYGTVDATPLFIVLLGETYRWTGDRDLLQELLPHAERALTWIDEHADLDDDGFVEYARRSAGGLVNQGWKDSGDGVPFPDGTLPEPPIALIEVQGYVYDAKMHMARLYEELDDPRSETLRTEAEQLRRRIHEVFWMEDKDYFALALDGDNRPVPTIASNPGHLLWSGVPTADQARRMAQVLLSDDMFSGWGLRTLARQQPVYNPLSYHDGTIWPHDNALIALGLARYGFREEAATVLTALFEATLHFRYHRLPELFCGIWRGETDRPVDYPVSCSPQAWAAGALFPLIQGVLGISPAAEQRMLRLKRPHLPSRFQFLDVFNMRVGGTRVSLRFSRRGERTMANVVGMEGDPLHVRIDVS